MNHTAWPDKIKLRGSDSKEHSQKWMTVCWTGENTKWWVRSLAKQTPVDLHVGSNKSIAPRFLYCESNSHNLTPNLISKHCISCSGMPMQIRLLLKTAALFANANTDVRTLSRAAIIDWKAVWWPISNKWGKWPLWTCRHISLVDDEHRSCRQDVQKEFLPGCCTFNLSLILLGYLA